MISYEIMVDVMNARLLIPTLLMTSINEKDEVPMLKASLINSIIVDCKTNKKEKKIYQ